MVSATVVVFVVSLNPTIYANPLDAIYPAGATTGTTVDVELFGNGATGAASLLTSVPGLKFERLKEERQFRLTIPADTAPGIYDVHVISPSGVSSSRHFVVSDRYEYLEQEPNTTLSEISKSTVIDATNGVGGVINGRLQEKGDVDHHRFRAKRGQRIVLECWAERIGSSLRPILELCDATGRRLQLSQSDTGIDPRIDFLVEADGVYIAKVFDLTFTGDATHVYRLDIDAGPRVLFALPPVVQKGKTAKVRLFGTNLAPQAEPVVAAGGSSAVSTPREVSESNNLSSELESVAVELLAPESATFAPALHLKPAQIALDGFPYLHPGATQPILVALTDLPVITITEPPQTPANSLVTDYPVEICGQLTGGDERHWFAFDAERGEVLWFEAFGERIGSPVDLDLAVLDAEAQREYIRFTDEPRNPGRTAFPTDHSDPAGRWVVPADGRYLVVVRNLLSTLADDPRRVYRISIRREDPDFQLALLPARSPAAINIKRGGRQVVEVLAFRRRGHAAPIRVRATNLPPGIECPPIWINSNTSRGPLVLTARRSAEPIEGTIELVGESRLYHPDVNHLDLNQVDVSSGGTANSFLYTGHGGDADELSTTTIRRAVRGGTMVHGRQPTGIGRLTAAIPLAIRGDSLARVEITANDTRFQQGTVITLGVDVHRENSSHNAEVKLIGAHLPPIVRNETATIAAGRSSGHICFYLPAELPIGVYTLVVKATTEVGILKGDGKTEAQSVTLMSNPVSFEVYPAPFVVRINPTSPRKIRRGEVLQVAFTAYRQNGFIGKLHTELVAPGGVVGLRGRGVTFISQTESGNIQIIANEDAPLGQQPFLQFEALGTVEDKAIYRSSNFVYLEIIEKEKETAKPDSEEEK